MSTCRCCPAVPALLNFTQSSFAAAAVVKVFDVNGNLKLSTAETAFKTPNRVAHLRESRSILVKDERHVRVLSADGLVVGVFGDRDLRQPVGLAQAHNGDVLVTEWTSSTVCLLSSNYTHTHTHPFNAPLSGTTRVSQY